MERQSERASLYLVWFYHCVWLHRWMFCCGLLTWGSVLLWQPRSIALPTPASSSSQPTLAPQILAQQNQPALASATVYSLRGSAQLRPYEQTARDAQLNDLLVPLDALRTAAQSRADLLFNEGSIARVDASSTFFFRQGLRRYQLSNRIANGTVLVLEDGIALIIVPPNGIVTQIETPQGRINIAATTATAGQRPASESPVLAQAPALLAATKSSADRTVLDWQTKGRSIDPSMAQSAAQPNGQTETAQTEISGEVLRPPERSSVVVVSHDSATGKTQVFALTDGDITVSDLEGKEIQPLIGGQTVAVTNGQVGQVQTFDLATFYQTLSLTAGLAAGQEAIVAQEPPAVQTTLNLARIETLAALRRQERERDTFRGTFLRDALSGADGFNDGFHGGFDARFNGQRGRGNVVTVGGQSFEGTFQRSPNDPTDSDIVRGRFIPDNDPNNPINIEANLDRRTIRINGRSGRSNDAGLSGNAAAGTVNLEGGRVVRIEVFDVGGEAPRPGEQYRGRLRINAIQPDR